MTIRLWRLQSWQETGGARNFPHYGRTYATAVEPSACLFGHGLLAAIEQTHTQLTLSDGESRTPHHLIAVLVECGRAVHRSRLLSCRTHMSFDPVFLRRMVRALALILVPPNLSHCM
jgi:hypothetical protein